jgi:hypothetical protein
VLGWRCRGWFGELQVAVQQALRIEQQEAQAERDRVAAGGTHFPIAHHHVVMRLRRSRRAEHEAAPGHPLVVRQRHSRGDRVDAAWVEHALQALAVRAPQRGHAFAPARRVGLVPQRDVALDEVIAWVHGVLPWPGECRPRCTSSSAIADNAWSAFWRRCRLWLRAGRHVLLELEFRDLVAVHLVGPSAKRIVRAPAYM